MLLISFQRCDPIWFGGHEDCGHGAKHRQWPQRASAREEAGMDFRDRHVMVTGGTGALGRAVVASLLAAGARCHVPYRDEREAGTFPASPDAAVTLIHAPSLADERVVKELYAGLP